MGRVCNPIVRRFGDSLKSQTCVSRHIWEALGELCSFLCAEDVTLGVRLVACLFNIISNLAHIVREMS